MKVIARELTTDYSGFIDSNLIDVGISDGRRLLLRDGLSIEGLAHLAAGPLIEGCSSDPAAVAVAGWSLPMRQGLARAGDIDNLIGEPRRGRALLDFSVTTPRHRGLQRLLAATTRQSGCARRQP